MKKPLPSTLLVAKKLEEALPEGGLNDRHLKIIAYFTQHVLGIKRYELHFDVAKKPKEIRILVQSEDGKPLRFRLKRLDLLAALTDWLQLPEYDVKIGE